jgi:hypothetical protein
MAHFDYELAFRPHQCAVVLAAVKAGLEALNEWRGHGAGQP